MQAVLLLAAKAAAAVGLSAGTAATASAATAAAGTSLAAATSAAAAAGFTATPAMLSAGAASIGAGSAAMSAASILGALRVGSSLVTALGVNAQAQMQAQAMRAEAFEAELQGRQEFVQSVERSNQIQREYNEFVEQSLAAASASGFDLGSGSVADVRARAQQDADRQTTITRNGAVMNAALRRSRASYLRGAAGLTRDAGRIAAAGEVIRGGIDASRLG